MATLTEVSVIARKTIKFGAIGLVILMFIPVVMGIAKRAIQRANPPPPTPPNQAYGPLPSLMFPKIDYPATPEIKLETITGGLPALENIAKVYLVGINKSRLLTLSSYSKKASAIGLSSNPIQIDDRIYRFDHPNIPAFMTVDLITDQVEYKYDWTREKNSLIAGRLGNAESVKSEAKNFFNRLQILPAEINRGEARVLFLTATGSAFLPIDTYLDANFARVDLFRENIDEKKVVTAGGDTSPVNILFSASSNQDSKVVSASFYFSKIIGPEFFATYPLKGVGKAFEELVAGKGYIVKNVTPIAYVRRAYLAYYESGTPQDYIQPVYVFEGDGGFVAYVQAIASEAGPEKINSN